MICRAYADFREHWRNETLVHAEVTLKKVLSIMDPAKAEVRRVLYHSIAALGVTFVLQFIPIKADNLEQQNRKRGVL